MTDEFSCPPPAFTPDEQLALADTYFGITGEIKALVSERDQNARLTTDDGAYVLKIANPAVTESFMDLQNKALEHLERTAPDLELPRLIKAKDGSVMVSHTEGDRSFFIRLVTYIDGTMFEDGSRSPEMLSSAGTYMGKLNKAFEGFEHDGAIRPDFLWNMDGALRVEPWVDDIVKPENQAMVQRVLDYYRAHCQNKHEGLRKAVIHNDANDANVIIDPDTEETIAVIDFGDMVCAAVVNDLATAAAYMIMGTDDIIYKLQCFVRAFHAEFPLTEDEQEILSVLTAMRMVMSVCISSNRAKAFPDNLYLLQSQDMAFAALKEFETYGFEYITDKIREACQ